MHFQFDENSPAAIDGDHFDPIDWTTPADEAMAREEEGTPEAQELRTLLSHSPDAKEAVIRFLQAIIPLKDGKVTPITALSGFRRFHAIAGFLLPDVGRIPFSELAEALGCSRALLSLYHVQTSDRIGGANITNRGQKARKVYAQRQVNVWRQKQVKATAETRAKRREALAQFRRDIGSATSDDERQAAQARYKSTLAAIEAGTTNGTMSH